MQLVGTGITTAFAAHLAAALPAARWPAVTALNIYADNLLRTPLDIRRSYVRVPDAPGLGIEIDEQSLESFRRNATGPKPQPRTIYTVRWPYGRTAEYVSVRAYERDFMTGNQPLFERGVTLTHARGRRQCRVRQPLSRRSGAGRTAGEFRRHLAVVPSSLIDQCAQAGIRLRSW